MSLTRSPSGSRKNAAMTDQRSGRWSANIGPHPSAPPLLCTARVVHVGVDLPQHETVVDGQRKPPVGRRNGLGVLGVTVFAPRCPVCVLTPEALTHRNNLQTAQAWLHERISARSELRADSGGSAGAPRRYRTALADARPTPDLSPRWCRLRSRRTHLGPAEATTSAPWVLAGVLGALAPWPPA